MLPRVSDEDGAMELFWLVWKGQGGTRAVNSSLFEKNSFVAFEKRLRTLADNSTPLPRRVDAFLHLRGAAIWGTSLLLCYVDPYRYPFVARFMIDLLRLDWAQLSRAARMAEKRYERLRTKGLSRETWRYLAYKELFEEVRTAMSVRSFLGVQNIFWNAWTAKQQVRVKQTGGISPEEALKRGRLGEYLVIRWEKLRGRTPHNRADENLGYDIESLGRRGRPRFIEVKLFGGRPIELTDNEEKTARELRTDYFLYVVEKIHPGEYTIRTIRDPARTCTLKAKRTVHHTVRDWQEWGTVSTFHVRS